MQVEEGVVSGTETKQHGESTFRTTEMIVWFKILIPSTFCHLFNSILKETMQHECQDAVNYFNFC